MQPQLMQFRKSFFVFISDVFIPSIRYKMFLETCLDLESIYHVQLGLMIESSHPHHYYEHFQVAYPILHGYPTGLSTAPFAMDFSVVLVSLIKISVLEMKRLFKTL